jgi:DNA repair protein RadC
MSNIRDVADKPTVPDNHGEGHRKRLRERYERAGFAAFAEHEVLELLLTLCIPRRDVKQPAKNLLARFGTLRGVMDAPPEELRKVEGIGSVTPVALSIIRDAATLYLQQGIETREPFTSSNKLGEFLRMRFAGKFVECVEVLYLDSGKRLMQDGVETIETGTVDSVTLLPRKLVESALRRGAKSLVVAHNHPGGSAHFSSTDIELTWNVKNAAASVGIELVDHMLVAGEIVLSMREERLLDNNGAEELRMVSERQAPYGQRPTPVTRRKF